PVDQRDLHRRAPQGFRGVEAAKSAPHHHDPMAQAVSLSSAFIRLICRNSRNSERFSDVSMPSNRSPSITSAQDPPILGNASERSISGGTRTKLRSIAPAT